MKLDRNLNSDGMGKYAVVKLRDLGALNGEDRQRAEEAMHHLGSLGLLDLGNVGTESEFFLIRLKDKYAQFALRTYGVEAAMDDTEYAKEIFEMANRAGPSSPWCKKPD